MDELNNILSKFGGTEQLWNYIKMYAAKGGREVTKTILELFYVMKSPNTGMIDKTLIGAALAYQLLPEDLVPRDRYGLLGFLDNGVTLAFAYNRVKTLVTPQIENQVSAMLDQWFGPEDPGVPQKFREEELPELIALYRTGDYAQALEEGKKALALAPGDARLRENVRLMEEKAGAERGEERVESGDRRYEIGDRSLN